MIHSLIDPSFQLLSSPTHVNLTHSKVIIGDFCHSGAWSVHDSAAWCSGASLLLRSVSTVFILFGAWRGLALGRFGACTLVLCLRSLVLDLSPVLSTLALNPGAQSPKALNAFRISPATSVAVARSSACLLVCSFRFSSHVLVPIASRGSGLYGHFVASVLGGVHARLVQRACFHLF